MYFGGISQFEIFKSRVEFLIFKSARHMRDHSKPAAKPDVLNIDI